MGNSRKRSEWGDERRGERLAARCSVLWFGARLAPGSLSCVLQLAAGAGLQKSRQQTHHAQAVSPLQHFKIASIKVPSDSCGVWSLKRTTAGAGRFRVGESSATVRIGPVEICNERSEFR